MKDTHLLFNCDNLDKPFKFSPVITEVKQTENYIIVLYHSLPCALFRHAPEDSEETTMG